MTAAKFDPPQKVGRVAYHSAFRGERFSRSPAIKDGYGWFLQEKADMIAAALWYSRSAQVDGDYVEFGVYEGMTFVQAWHTAQQLEMPIRFHAFDSFEGLPAIDDEGDRGGPHAEGMFSDAGRGIFVENLATNAVDPERVTITEGFFDASLTTQRREEIGLKSAAVVWVDCDLYTSTVSALDFITEVIVDGAVLIFDDWFAYKGNPERGEERAFREWLAANPGFDACEYRTFGHLGKSFLVQRLHEGATG